MANPTNKQAIAMPAVAPEVTDALAVEVSDVGKAAADVVEVMVESVGPIVDVGVVCGSDNVELAEDGFKIPASVLVVLTLDEGPVVVVIDDEPERAPVDDEVEMMVVTGNVVKAIPDVAPMSLLMSTTSVTLEVPSIDVVKDDIIVAMLK